MGGVALILFLGGISCTGVAENGEVFVEICLLIFYPFSGIDSCIVFVVFWSSFGHNFQFVSNIL